MRRSASIAALLLVLAPSWVPAAAAQKLNLDPTPSFPALPQDNAATALASVLTREIESLRKAPAADPDAALARDASVAWRRVAHELLVRGDAGSGASPAVIVGGFRLAEARAEFDAAMAALPRGTPQALEAAAALRNFVDRAPGAVRAAKPAQLLVIADGAVAALAPVLAALGQPAAGQHWVDALGPQPAGPAPAPTTDPAAPSGAPAAAPTTAPTAAPAAVPAAAPAAAPPGESGTPGQDALAAAAADQRLAEPVRGAFALAARRLQSAETFPDLRGEALAARAELEGLPAALAAIASASWLPGRFRDAVAVQAAESIQAWMEASTRVEARARLERLRCLGEVVQVAQELVTSGGADGARGPVDPRRVNRALEAFEAAPPDADEARASQARLRMMRTLLETVQEVRRAERSDVRKDLRSAQRELLQDARRTEDPVLRQVETLAAPGASPTDPAVGSLLDSQRRRIRNLARLARLSQVLDDMQSRLADRAGPVATQARRQLSFLSNPTRAADAEAALDALCHQWAFVGRFPGENLVRHRNEAALACCAGHDHQLLAAMDARRDAWADAWGRGNPNADAVRSAMDMARVGLLIEEHATLAGSGLDPRLLGRWAGWDDFGGLPGSTDAMHARIALAVDAVVRNDDASLRESLDRLAREAPLWRLRAHLLTRLGPALSTLPTGLAGTMGRAAASPPPGAFLADQRDALALLGRASREYLYAQRRSDDALTEALAAAIRAKAGELLAAEGTITPEARAVRLQAGAVNDSQPARRGRQP